MSSQLLISLFSQCLFSALERYLHLSIYIQMNFNRLIFLIVIDVSLCLSPVFCIFLVYAFVFYWPIT